MEYHTQHGSLVDEPEEDSEIMDHYAAMLERTANRVREAWIEVALAGPAQVEKIAGEIAQTSKGLAELARARANGSSFHLSPYFPGALTHLVQDFIGAAREALGDDGTEARVRNRQ
ncbi:hypothetical protein ACQEV2_29055 [Streptomyces sp. CA-251387]|uniref:hypothetical protein n=1 Tax=Streptomyces sp. CA-251387 TaxID=3240064 RepID=UPI003D8BDAFC